MSKNIKTILLGQSGVGKTSIVHRFLNKTFTTNLDTTIGAAFNKINITDFYSEKRTNLNSDSDCFLEIWDTAGQERYYSLLPMYFRGSDCIIMVFDITNNNSFNKIKNYFEEIIFSNGVLIILIGNKIDMNNNRTVSKIDILNFCNQRNITYIESSAKDNINIKEIFVYIIKNIDPNNLKLTKNSFFKNNFDKENNKCCF